MSNAQWEKKESACSSLHSSRSTASSCVSWQVTLRNSGYVWPWVTSDLKNTTKWEVPGLTPGQARFAVKYDVDRVFVLYITKCKRSTIYTDFWYPVLPKKMQMKLSNFLRNTGPLFSKLLHVKFISYVWILRFYARTCTRCEPIFPFRLGFPLGAVNITRVNPNK